MRLDENERLAIIEACQAVAGKHLFLLFLFGSRVDDTQRGGDIDLLLLVEEDLLSTMRWQKHVFLSEIKQRLGEQKIDFIITSPQLLKSDEFLKKIRSTAVILFDGSLISSSRPKQDGGGQAIS